MGAFPQGGGGSNALRPGADPLGAGGLPPDDVDIPDINGMVAGERRLGGMGLYIIRELVDEAGFIETDEDEGNQFHMVIYRITDGSSDPEIAATPG